MRSTINLPKQMVDKMLKVSVAFGDLHDELEDYLIARQPQLVKRLRRARRQHLAGEVHPFLEPR